MATAVERQGLIVGPDMSRISGFPEVKAKRQKYYCSMGWGAGLFLAGGVVAPIIGFFTWGAASNSLYSIIPAIVAIAGTILFIYATIIVLRDKSSYSDEYGFSYQPFGSMGGCCNTCATIGTSVLCSLLAMSAVAVAISKSISR